VAASFASTADVEDKQESLEALADGVYVPSAEGDPSLRG
jgi:hypothetical protein